MGNITKKKPPIPRQPDDLALDIKKAVNKIEEMSLEDVRKEIPLATYKSILLAVRVLEGLMKSGRHSDKARGARFMISKLSSKAFIEVLGGMTSIERKAIQKEVRFRERKKEKKNGD